MSRRGGSRSRFKRSGEVFFTSNGLPLPRPYGEGVAPPRVSPGVFSPARRVEVFASSPRRLSVDPRPAGRRVARSFRPGKVPFQVVMRVPARVRFCVERKQRREVLFARGVAGRGGGRHGSYRRTANSYYSC